MANIQRRQQIWKDLGGNLTEKAAELANTYDMPAQSASSKTKVDGKDKSVIKTSSAPLTQEQVEELILKQAFGNKVDTPAAADSGGATGTNEEDMLADQPSDVPQAKYLKPRVDVSGKEPPKQVVQKTAQRYALPSLGRYPLDSYGEVEKAAAYFDEWHRRMDPPMRREFCQNMVKRASALNIPTSELSQRYASDHWAPVEQIKIALDARRTVTLNEDHLVMLDKLAEQQRLMHPDDFAATLGEFDKLAGLNHHYDVDVPDPYFSCFAKTAQEGASPTEEDPDASIIVGNEYITKRKMVTFSTMGQKQLEQRFGKEFAGEFASDPISIFDSMPRDQKLVLIRMANTNDSATQGASTA